MEKEALKAKRLAVLEDTAKHFNINTRCVSTVDGNESGCQYSPIKGKSEGCAVGRLITNKKLCRRLDNGEFGGYGVGILSVFNALPIELQELGQGFLKDLQNLHDSTSYWDEIGLSDTGKQVYAIIYVRVVNGTYYDDSNDLN